MPRPSLRSRSLRKVKKKLPGGRLTTHFEKKKSSRAKCGSCGVLLAGMTAARVGRAAFATKSKKRPERPYGGVLCSKCMRQKIVAKVRNGVK
tara:strand:+ start:38751 stop:39026 length:276 start_codon:yes stop_codon:yes gene_type:complete